MRMTGKWAQWAPQASRREVDMRVLGMMMRGEDYFGVGILKVRAGNVSGRTHLNHPGPL